ncbi:MAG TPA: hypothetical protein VFJ82_21130 [Longimicrobium sp.]|nr:hypothetical protein [Longimicrobium sp.]
MRGARSAAGATLLELVVTLVILGVAAAVVVPALRHAADAPPTLNDRVAAARRDALEHGRAVTVQLRDSTGAHLLTAFPDGRVVADSGLALDPLNGRPRAAR